MHALVDTWHIHNRIHLYLIDAIAPEALTVKAAAKGRTVGEIFAHIHNVRLEWLDAAVPDLVGRLARIDRKELGDPAFIRRCLEQSGLAIGSMLQHTLQTGKVPGFKPHPTAFFGYLLSHESHHRGEIGMILSEAGYKLDKNTQFGLWEWGSR